MKHLFLFIACLSSTFTFSQKKIKPELLGQLILNSQQLDKKIDGDFLSQQYLFKKLLKEDKASRNIAKLLLYQDSAGVRKDENWTLSFYKAQNQFYTLQLLIPINDIDKVLSIIGKDKYNHYQEGNINFINSWNTLYSWDSKHLSVLRSYPTDNSLNSNNSKAKRNELVNQYNKTFAQITHRSGNIKIKHFNHDARLWFSENLLHDTELQETFFGRHKTRDFQEFIRTINYGHNYKDFSMTLDFNKDNVTSELTYGLTNEFIKEEKNQLKLKSINNLSEYLDPNAIANSTYFMNLEKMLPLLEKSLLGEREFRKFKSISRIFLSNKYYKDVLDGNIALSYLRDTTKEVSYISYGASFEGEEAEEIEEVKTYTKKMPLILGAIGITNSSKVDSMMNYFLHHNIIQKTNNHYRISKDTTLLFRRLDNAFIVSNDSLSLFQSFEHRTIKSTLMMDVSIEKIIKAQIARTTRERTLREYATYNSYFKNIQYNGFIYRKKKIYHTFTLPLKKSTHNSATTLLQLVSDFIAAKQK